MLSEVGTIRPAVVILWMTDRLGRDRFEEANVKRRLRDAGCRICLVAEPTQDDSPESVSMETMMEGMAEVDSRQLSVIIRRGMTYKRKPTLFNGHKVWGDGVDDEKRYAGGEAMNKMLKNSAYVGGYHHSIITVEGGMPHIVDKGLFDRCEEACREQAKRGEAQGGRTGAGRPRATG